VTGASRCQRSEGAVRGLDVERDVDCVALDQALAYRYVPAPRSGFKDVEKLPPGHFGLGERRGA